MSFTKHCAFHVYYENGAKQTVAPKTVYMSEICLTKLLRTNPRHCVSHIKHFHILYNIGIHITVFR